MSGAHSRVMHSLLLVVIVASTFVGIGCQNRK